MDKPPSYSRKNTVYKNQVIMHNAVHSFMVVPKVGASVYVVKFSSFFLSDGL